MHLLSVNVGRASPVQNGKLSRQTGIYKFPVPGPTAVMREGLDGDDICDSKNHGGVDQALYVYGAPDYEWWSKALGRELPPGTFGENLTISDLVSAHIWIGDRLHIGTVTLEVTAPRVPCRTLSTRMGDAGFVKRFREAERPGLYCRVIHEGIVRAGQPVTLERHSGESVSALEIFRDFYAASLDEATLRRHLAAPIAIRDRSAKQAQLTELLQQDNGRET
ncbi:MAG TPA: MOSC domain-containing protein [Terriglobia bacterium]|nr:MOSC domain-containing protein [Terriglobia bacterium]